MSIVNEFLAAEAAEKREKDVVAWAMACGMVDGMNEAIAVVLAEVGRLFVKGDDAEAILMRNVVRLLSEKKKELNSAIPKTPDPSPAMDD